MKKIFTLLLAGCTFCFSAHSQVIINEIYGGGGNNGATYTHDFIELYNNGGTDVNLMGWSVQYASSGGSTWTVTSLTGSIPAHGYYLIQEAKGNGGTTALPTPDLSGSIRISGTKGKVILCNTSVEQSGENPATNYPAGPVIDKVGFGSSATGFETSPAPGTSNTISVQRNASHTDSDNNSTDFSTAFPSPVNSAGPDVMTPTVTTFFPVNEAINVPTSFTAIITFNESITKGTGSIIIKKSSDNSVLETIDILNSSVTVTGAELQIPIHSLSLSTSYYIEIGTDAVNDLANNSFAGISSSNTWSFTTAASLPSGVLGTTYHFNSCTSSITDGFTSYSVAGSAVWSCTTFGRDPANPAGTAAFESAVQINGYSDGGNQLNEDWFISPAFDLAATNYPLLSFWSRNAFIGDALQLKVSTDYPGTGDPTAYTWINLNGKFPNEASNTWALSENINLTAYKSANTYFAFVYHSTTESGARWTLDDILLKNSLTPPPASVTTNATEIPFKYVPVATQAVKHFIFTGNNLTDDVTLTATGDFLISKTTSGFSGAITYSKAEANNISTTFYIQFAPTQDSKRYTGNISLNTPGVPEITISLSGNSINPALTLEVVNWNLEWFGSLSPSLGPTDKNLQEANIKTITQNIGADIFAFAEVVSEVRLQQVVAHLNSVYGAGAYAYVISNYGSHTNPFASEPGPLSAAQKEAFVYKTAVINPIGTPVALIANGVNTAADLSNPAYDWFASGRYPFMMHANVTLGGVTKPVRFVLIHAKANTSPTTTSYNRRKAGADTLHYTLNNLYPTDNIIMLGDFNDDLDESITTGFTVSSYVSFNNDAASFYPPTLALSLAGKKSTTGYNDMIDHVELSNEMKPYYLGNSASVLADVATLVSNYGSTTTDHYPIFTRYAFDEAILPIKLLSFTVAKHNYTAVLEWATSREYNTHLFLAERSADNSNWITVGSVKATGNQANGNTYSLTDFRPEPGNNYYRLKQIDINGKVQYSLVRKVFFDETTSLIISPNPANNYVNINFTRNGTALVTIDIINVEGKLIHHEGTAASSVKLNLNQFAKGTYFIKVTNEAEISIRKLLIQ